MNLLFLYLEFFKIGIFAVGGGLATLPFLFIMANDQFTFIRESGWLSTEQLGNFIAIAQSSPGAIGVNVTAQTGYQYSGIGGGIIAVLGLISPAIIVIAVITRAMKTFHDNKITASVFSGLRPAAGGLLAGASLRVWRLALYNSGAAAWYEIIRWRESLVCAVIFLLIIKLRKHPIVYVGLGAAAGLILQL